MEERRDEDAAVSAEAAGALVSILEAGILDVHQSRAMERLLGLHDSDEFASLPDDLRERIRKLVSPCG